MAGIKITDLQVLTSPVSEDLLYIVDVSDTSQSPQGTSKQIELGNIVSSGTWTPTLSGFNDAIVGANIDSARYSRTGNIVTCSMDGLVTIDFSSLTSGSFDITLPIAGTGATGCVNINFPNQCNGIIKSPGRIVLSSNDTTLNDSGIPFSAIFQYEIS